MSWQQMGSDRRSLCQFEQGEVNEKGDFMLATEEFAEYRKSISRTVLIGFLVGITHSQSLAEVVFDNLDNVRNMRQDWVTSLGSDNRFAQQFLLGDNTNVDQVTLLFQRPRAGVSGSLRFELWRDNGSGKPVAVDDPSGKLADLGKIIDVTQIPVGEFGEFTLDNLIVGLEPNQPYWIVTDFAEVTGIRGDQQNIGWASIGDPYWNPGNPHPPGYDATAGTNGAAHVHGYRDAAPREWQSLRDFFNTRHEYQAMKVEAGADTSVDEIDVLSSALRQGFSSVEFDINQDGIVNADDRNYWIQHSDYRNTYFGDANLDGEFDSTDLTLVFQAGEYEDNITLNSSWAEGDWNGDGDFESGDLIAAFQDGGYEMGPRAAVNAVPEPTCGMLIVMGAVAIWRLRIR